MGARLSALVGVGLLVVGCRSAGTGAPPDGPMQVDPPWWTPAGLERLRDAVQPLVEAHAGRRFTAPPPVGVFDPDGFAEHARREARLVVDTVYNDTPEPLRATLAEQHGRIGAGGLFGKYGLYDRTTWLVPATIQAVAEAADADPERSRAELARELATVVLAHELTHALQNQEHDGAALLPHLVDQDHFHGWSAVSEGGANLIALRVARDLGLEDAFWLLSDRQGWGPEGLREPAAYPIWVRYGRGMHALEQVVQTGGMDAFWRWHAEPPASSAMVFRPETYAPTPPPRTLDWAQVLRGTEQALTEGPWMASNTRLGEHTLRGEAIRTGHEQDFEPILAHLVDAQHLDLARADRRGDIRVLVFDSPEPARAYLELLRAEQTEEGRQLARMLGVTVEVSYAELPGVPGDASLLRTQRVRGAGGVATETRTAWVVRGPDVVAVTAEGFRPGVRLADTLRAVFDQLDAARAP